MKIAHEKYCLNRIPNFKRENTLTGWLRSIDGTSCCTYVAFTYYVPVTQKDEACWMVQSESVQYIIHLVNKTCNCKLFCTNCHACVCTCTLALHPIYTSYHNAVKGDFLSWTVITRAWMQHSMQQFSNIHLVKVITSCWLK